jgi:hypothetical protein
MAFECGLSTVRKTRPCYGVGTVLVYRHKSFQFNPLLDRTAPGRLEKRNLSGLLPYHCIRCVSIAFRRLGCVRECVIASEGSATMDVVVRNLAIEDRRRP